jgi:hypothetical protein
MAAPDSTKLQANFKLPDGTLINIYATSQAELEAQLTTVQDVAELIKSTALALGSAGNVAHAAKALNATPVVDTPPFNSAPATPGGAQDVRDKYGNLWIYNHPQAPECARGKMVLKHGTAQATGKPYKGWFDPAAGPNWAGPKIAKEEQFQTVWA